MATPLDDLAGRCHRNYAEAFWQFLRGSPGARRQDPPGGLLVRCDLRFPISNVAFHWDPERPLAEFLAAADTFFAPNWPWRIISTAPDSEDAARLAKSHGLRPAPRDPGLRLDPIPQGPPTPGPLTVRVVTTDAEFADFGSVWCSAFRLPPWILPVALPRVPPDDPERRAVNRCLVGYADGRPVACAAVTVTEGVAGLSSIGTVPTARGRGFGTAITAHALAVGESAGATVAYLAASRMGYPVYERMGFRRTADYPTWQTPFGLFRMLRGVRSARRLARVATGRP